MARKAISNDRYRLIGTYERLRKALVERPDDGRLDKHFRIGYYRPIAVYQSRFWIDRCGNSCLSHLMS